jgi:hypothetical protein
VQEAISPRPRFVWPLWIQISLAALMFLDAGLDALRHFLQFEWVTWLCFGMFWLINVPRQEGEPIGKYFRNPRSIVSFAFLVASMVGFGYVIFFAR